MDLLINMDIHFAGVGFLILLKRKLVSTMILKYFGLLEHVFLFPKRFFIKLEVLIRVSLLIWKKLIYAGEHLIKVIILIL